MLRRLKMLKQSLPFFSFLLSDSRCAFVSSVAFTPGIEPVIRARMRDLNLNVLCLL